ncbi:MAG: hypothetical protein ABIL40_10790 [candidate division WOR-3 bacterium]
MGIVVHAEDEQDGIKGILYLRCESPPSSRAAQRAASGTQVLPPAVER